MLTWGWKASFILLLEDVMIICLLKTWRKMKTMLRAFSVPTLKRMANFREVKKADGIIIPISQIKKPQLRGKGHIFKAYNLTSSRSHFNILDSLTPGCGMLFCTSKTSLGLGGLKANETKHYVHILKSCSKYIFLKIHKCCFQCFTKVTCKGWKWVFSRKKKL